jgi:SAM-dependent methyltransferase
MERSVYAVEAAVEKGHWWFRGRRRLLRRALTRLAIERDARVVDVGSGTGANLRVLRELGFRHICGVDSNPDAIRWCEAKGLGKVVRADAGALPLRDEVADLVLAADILEHMDDDRQGLDEIRRILRPRGTAIITVPAFSALWGLQDVVSHHKRRYHASELAAKLGSAGFVVRELHYFNYLLFLPIWSARQAIRVLRVRLDSENQVNSPLLNRVLAGIFAFDVTTSPRLKPPFGVSLFAMLGRR